MPHALAPAAPHVQPALLGDRLHAVGPGRGREEGVDLLDLLGGQLVEGADLPSWLKGCWCVSRHTYERTAAGRRPEADRAHFNGNQLVTRTPLLRYAR
ncbi:hypothetical protein GCM10014713_56440 [Streptomyces purpureus]|uniref:Uncharacterized protein n=1 Tax=Streptomyces purpureus TaxID=1951 RepID=A0A918LVC8_9ACTN|nr:hypothetical protein GCM10014713_56440 [Streptomyces purpureus]